MADKDRSWKTIEYKNNRIFTTAYDRKNGITTIKHSATNAWLSSPISKLLAVIVITLVVAFVIRVANGIEQGKALPTFTDFLNMLSNADVIRPNFNTIDIDFSWLGNLTLLTRVLEMLQAFMNFVIWLLLNLVVCIEYIFYFLKWVFVVS